MVAFVWCVLQQRADVKSHFAANNDYITQAVHVTLGHTQEIVFDPFTRTH